MMALQWFTCGRTANPNVLSYADTSVCGLNLLFGWQVVPVQLLLNQMSFVELGQQIIHVSSSMTLSS